MLPCLVMVLLSKTKFYSFEYLEFLWNLLAESPFTDEPVHPVNLRLLCLHIEDLTDDRFKLFLHLRNVEIAVIGEAYSSETFFGSG